MGQVDGQWCAEPCQIDEDCPGALSGPATPYCDDGTCKLDCNSFGVDCPTGMECLGLALGTDFCAYPVP